MKVNPHPIRQLIFSKKSRLFGIIVRTTKTWMIFQPEISDRLFSRTNHPWAGVLILPTQPQIILHYQHEKSLGITIHWHQVTWSPSTRVACNDPCWPTKNPGRTAVVFRCQVAAYLFQQLHLHTLHLSFCEGFWGSTKTRKPGEELKEVRVIHHCH